MSRTTPSVEEQRQLFWEYDSQDRKVKYRQVRSDAGGFVGTVEERWALFARRWRPVRTSGDWTPPPLHPQSP